MRVRVSACPKLVSRTQGGLRPTLMQLMGYVPPSDYDKSMLIMK